MRPKRDDDTKKWRAKNNPGARYARLLHFARRAGKREERRVEQDIVLTPFLLSCARILTPKYYFLRSHNCRALNRFELFIISR
jgi:hypothetical protein